jgi:glycolate oxidase iron-sulfur subunit
MHCGLCLPTCPTYDATKLERHSPRGRIALMRAIADDRLAPTKTFGEEMYFCLGCLACVTACPAGVDYAGLFELARAEVERVGRLDTPKRKLIRWFAVKWLFADLRRLRLLGRLMRVYQWRWLGIQSFIRRCGGLRLFPRRLRELEAITPDIPRRFSHQLIAEVTPAVGGRRHRVALLTGCAQDLIFSDVNRDAVRCWLGTAAKSSPRRQHCCGSSMRTTASRTRPRVADATSPSSPSSRCDHLNRQLWFASQTIPPAAPTRLAQRAVWWIFECRTSTNGWRPSVSRRPPGGGRRCG